MLPPPLQPTSQVQSPLKVTKMSNIPISQRRRERERMEMPPTFSFPFFSFFLSHAQWHHYFSDFFSKFDRIWRASGFVKIPPTLNSISQSNHICQPRGTVCTHMCKARCMHWNTHEKCRQGTKNLWIIPWISSPGFFSANTEFSRRTNFEDFSWKGLDSCRILETSNGKAGRKEFTMEGDGCQTTWNTNQPTLFEHECAFD